MESKWNISITKEENKIIIKYDTDIGEGMETILSNKSSIENYKFLREKLNNILGFVIVNEEMADNENNTLVITAQNNNTKELVLMEVDEPYEPGDLIQYWCEQSKELKDLTCVSYTAKISEDIFDYLTENE